MTFRFDLDQEAPHGETPLAKAANPANWRVMSEEIRNFRDIRKEAPANEGFEENLLRELEGMVSPSEWARIKADPAELAAHIETLRVNRILDAGLIPAGWTGAAWCRTCGWMPAEKWAEGAKLAGCAWCHTPAGKALRQARYVDADAEIRAIRAKYLGRSQ